MIASVAQSLPLLLSEYSPKEQEAVSMHKGKHSTVV